MLWRCLWTWTIEGSWADYVLKEPQLGEAFLARVLKPEGRIIFSQWNSSAK